MYLGSSQVYSANPITITAQPTNQTSSGGAATFTVSATASPGYTISYQWQYYSVYNTGSSNISGATSATLSLTGLASGLDNGNQYSCVLSTTGYSVVSNSATLTVPNKITITGQPSNQTITGTTASFTCTATISGGGTPSYTWYRQSLGIGSFLAVSGGTSSTLSLSGLSQSSNNGDKYFCQVSYSNEAVVTSSTATLTVGTGSAAWASKSSNWTAASFSGGGTSASDKFFKASLGDSAIDGAYATVPGAGTVRVTSTSVDCSTDFKIYKNGTVAYTFPDNSGDGTGVYSGVIPATGTNSCSITVASGAVIRIANSGDHTAFQNLYIWWESA
jgi:hypothetical protein